MRRASINAELAAAERRASASSLDTSSGKKKMDVNSQAPKELTSESALALVQPFFPKEWSMLAADDVALKILT